MTSLISHLVFAISDTNLMCIKSMLKKSTTAENETAEHRLFLESIKH